MGRYFSQVKTLQLSILIRNKNNSATILRSLEDVFNQTLSEDYYEIIVVDDGSTDDTFEIIQPFLSKIKLMKADGIGAVKALNLGIRSSSAELFTVLDADDGLPKNALKSLLTGLDKNKDAAAIYGNYREYTANSDTSVLVDTSQNVFDTIAGGILFKKQDVLESGLYDESLFFPEYDLLIKLMNNHPIAHINSEVYSYFRRLGSLTANKGRVAKGIQELNQKYGKIFPIREY